MKHWHINWKNYVDLLLIDESMTTTYSYSSMVIAKIVTSMSVTRICLLIKRIGFIFCWLYFRFSSVISILIISFGTGILIDRNIIATLLLVRAIVVVLLLDLVDRITNKRDMFLILECDILATIFWIIFILGDTLRAVIVAVTNLIY